VIDATNTWSRTYELRGGHLSLPTTTAWKDGSLRILWTRSKNDWISENCLAGILPRSQPTEGQISRATAVSHRIFAPAHFKRTRETRCDLAIVRPPGALRERFKLLIGVSRSR
jgi:hypothetical protein